MLAAAPPRNAPPRSRPTPLPTTNQCTRAAACHTPRPSRGKAGGLRNQRALDQQQKHARTRLQASPAHTRHACLPPHPHTACPAYASAPRERCMVRADPQGVRHPLTLRFRHLWHERVKTGKVRRGAAAHRRRAPGGRRGGGCGTVALHGAARPPPAAWRPRPGPRHRSVCTAQGRARARCQPRLLATSAVSNAVLRGWSAAAARLRRGASGTRSIAPDRIYNLRCWNGAGWGKKKKRQQ